MSTPILIPFDGPRDLARIAARPSAIFLTDLLDWRWSGISSRRIRPTRCAGIAQHNWLYDLVRGTNSRFTLSALNES